MRQGRPGLMAANPGSEMGSSPSELKCKRVRVSAPFLKNPTLVYSTCCGRSNRTRVVEAELSRLLKKVFLFMSRPSYTDPVNETGLSSSCYCGGIEGTAVAMQRIILGKGPFSA